MRSVVLGLQVGASMIVFFLVMLHVFIERLDLRLLNRIRTEIRTELSESNSDRTPVSALPRMVGYTLPGHPQRSWDRKLEIPAAPDNI